MSWKSMYQFLTAYVGTKYWFKHIISFRHVYPWAKDNLMLSHDSYFCEDFYEARLPFPRRREDNSCNFAGCEAMENEENFSFLKLEPGFATCPENCRAQKDWEYC